MKKKKRVTENFTLSKEEFAQKTFKIQKQTENSRK